MASWLPTDDEVQATLEALGLHRLPQAPERRSFLTRAERWRDTVANLRVEPGSQTNLTALQTLKSEYLAAFDILPNDVKQTEIGQRLFALGSTVSVDPDELAAMPHPVMFRILPPPEL